MSEALTLGLFIFSLLLCLLLGQSVIWALVFGLLLFIAYGLVKKHRPLEMLKMCLRGLKTISNIFIVLLIIGALTGLWRLSGTIPYIIYHATALIKPQVFILAAFLLNCAVSVLTGTAFGTAATMGVISMTMGAALGTSPLWTGGAILAGCFFGDRCSPMSTSALLVAELTGTTIFQNIPAMIKTSLLPFGVSCAVFLLAGFFGNAHGAAEDCVKLFAEHFKLSWLCALPAAVIILLSCFKVNVKITVTVSIVFSAAIAFFVQGAGWPEILSSALTGFKTSSAELSAMLSGGGASSMLSSVAIVSLTSCYSGIFEGTGLLNGSKSLISKLSKKTTAFAGVTGAALFTSLIGCNQALPIMLTHQLCSDGKSGDTRLATSLENTAVVIPPLIPWSIAGAIPLATAGAPAASILFACYLYLLPIWNLVLSFYRKNKANRRLSPK